MKTLLTFAFWMIVIAVGIVVIIAAAVFLGFKQQPGSRRRIPNETLDQRIERLWESLSDEAKDQVRSLKQAHAGGFLSEQDMKADIQKILNTVDIPIG
ncbi:MAG: hypothetical protein QG599_3337 [Pseudomonadota bacterium]|nr:hypothetical protein [Pseudomonadota bacterium]